MADGRDGIYVESQMSGAPDTAEFLRRRAERRQRSLADQARTARDALDAVGPVLRKRFGVRRVVLFGSLARGALHERSDVDIAVWGLDRTDEAAAADLIGQAVHLPVDLIRMEEASPSLHARVEADGVELVSDH